MRVAITPPNKWRDYGILVRGDPRAFVAPSRRRTEREFLLESVAICIFS